MSILSFLLLILVILNIASALILIFLERKDPAATWAWLMVLTLIPVLGFVLYLLLGQNLRRQKIFDTKTKDDKIVHKIVISQLEDLQNCESDYNNCNYDLNHQDTIKMHLIGSQSVFSRNNDVTIFTDGKDKFNQLISDIENAEDHIHILYYIIKNDDLSNIVLNALIKKARQGIKVRLLYDSLGSRSISKKLLKELKEAGGSAVSFFPSKIPYLSLRINYRNHRKLAIIDGKCGYIGGFNIGNEYIGLDKKFGYWRDNHLRIVGDSVRSIQMRFLLDWSHASQEKIEYRKRYYPNLDVKGNTGIQIVSSGPDSDEMYIKNGYLKMINSAKKNIYIQTPYFDPHESFLEGLKIASLSGVDVNIMIPAKPDHPFVHWASYSYIGDLLKSGVKAYAYEDGFLHAKTVIIDEEVASVGTANIDIRSFKLNFEVNAFVYDKSVASSLTNFFKEDLKVCDEITLEKYNARSNIVKIKESISRLLSPIL